MAGSSPDVSDRKSAGNAPSGANDHGDTVTNWLIVTLPSVVEVTRFARVLMVRVVIVNVSRVEPCGTISLDGRLIAGPAVCFGKT